MQAVGGGLSGLAAQFSDESALEVCIHVMRYTNRRLYIFTNCCRLNVQPVSPKRSSNNLSPKRLVAQTSVDPPNYYIGTPPVSMKTV